MLQRAARAQHRQRQDHEGRNRSLPPRHEPVLRTRRKQFERQPGRHHQHHERSQQHALVALPQHRPHFLGIEQVDEVQPIGPRVVFRDELRRGHLQQHIQHPPHAEPPRSDARRQRPMPEPRREHSRQRYHHGQQADVDTQPAQQHRPQAASRLYAVPHPERQPKPRQRQQHQDGENESKCQATHAAAPRKRRIAFAATDKRMPLSMPSKTMPPRCPKLKPGKD
ncbi:hypothetical protein D3C72_1456120 [compost metagenome]